MVRKGREPLTEAPPPAASSSDDEDSSSSSEDEEENSDKQKQQQQQQNQQNHSSSEEEDDDDEDEDDDDDDEEEEEEDQQQQQQQQNTPSTPPPTKKILLQKKPDPPNSGSDTETDSDSPPAKIKPIASKPIKPDTQPKKPRSLSKPTVTALSAPSSKRPANDTDKGSTAKKPKKDKNETTGSAQDEGKKNLFQRLWSEDDEIVILKGMIDYKAKKGHDPLSDADDFLDFIKNSLHVVDVKKDQMVNKIRRLKKKYQNARKKKITNPHELNSFELSKKIWGDEDGVDENHDNLTLKACTVKARASGSNSKAGGGKGVNGPAFDVVKKLEDGNKKNKGDEGANREVSQQRESAIQLGDLCKIGCVDEGFMKEGVKLLGEKERVELEEEWRKINVERMEGLLKRLELYGETTRRVLNAIKSAKH